MTDIAGMDQDSIAKAIGCTARTYRTWRKRPDFPADGTLEEMQEWAALNKRPTGPGGLARETGTDLRESKMRADIEATLNKTDRAQRKLLEAYEDEVVSRVAGALGVILDELDQACQGCAHLARVKAAIEAARREL